MIVFLGNHEIPGLSREIVEHRLDIKPEYRPFKQPPRRFNAQIYPRIKEEVERLLEAKFIQPCRYTEWISNIVPVKKKNGKLKLCVDFRYLSDLRKVFEKARAYGLKMNPNKCAFGVSAGKS